MSENFTFDTINIIAIITLSFNIFILVPLIIYCLYSFTKLRDDDLIKYRHPFAVYLLNSLVIIGLFTERVYHSFANIFCLISVPVWTGHFYFALTWDAILYLKLAKVYYVYYQQQLNLSIAQKVWVENINPDHDDSSWYIKHQDTFGNMTYLIKIVLIPWLFMSFVDGIIPSQFGDTFLIDLLHLCEGILPIFIAFIILYKIRLVNDIYKIRNEITIAMFIIGTSFVVYIITFITVHFDGSISLRMESLIYMFVTEGIAIACSILSTAYPVYLIKKHDKEILIAHQHANHVSTDVQTMNKILCEYKSFTVFMSYCVSEFCPENLLFLAELIQCKHAYQKKKNYVVKFPVSANMIVVDFNVDPSSAGSGHYKSDKDKFFTYLFHKTGTIITKLCLSPQVPTTAILTKNSEHLYFQMEALYFKYIKPGSTLELNISGSVKDKLKQIFEEDETIIVNTNQKRMIKMTAEKQYPEETLFIVMDECAMQIVKLLQYSMSRFISSDAFESISDSSLTDLNIDPNVSSDAGQKDILNDQQIGIIKFEPMIIIK